VPAAPTDGPPKLQRRRKPHGGETGSGLSRPRGDVRRTGRGLSRTERIRRRADFQRVYDRGARLHGQYSTVFVLRNDEGGCRLGIAATKKLGGAVLRNRAKRLIREIFRRNKIAEGLDIVVIPRRELLDASLTLIETDYLKILGRRRGRT
jgi:ribonuclease P protein component